jgi:DNA-binding NarL/FixJ family response regulator
MTTLLNICIGEREIFNLVTQGLTNAEIAVKLCISRRTVEVHRSNLLRKLGLRTQQEQLIKYANERDIKL